MKLEFRGTVAVARPSKAVETSEHGGLVVAHLHPCDLPMCDEPARHISPDDGAHLCDDCWDIELENRR